jgi:hypothetical protein
MLVLNLTVSDFINSAAGLISGSLNIRDKQLYPGRACTFDGWIVQLSAQATDFSILAISIATLLVVTRQGWLQDLSKRAAILYCLSVWAIPLITSSIATGMGVMGPVSGNWCWITSDRTGLRYGLVHGWRFAIIGITIAIYSYVWWYLSTYYKHMRHFRGVETESHTSQSSGLESGTTAPTSDEENKPPPLPLPVPCTQVISNPANTFIRSQSHRRYREIKRMLLLNGYPLLYVLLWMPGIVNRILEANGLQNHRVQNILQCSTQFVGFANAITYGLNQSWLPNR